MLRRSRLVATRAVLVLLAGCVGVTAQEPSLDRVLDKASQQVSSFLEKFSEVRCTEKVTQSRLSGGGHGELTKQSTFDYFTLLQGTGDELTFSESRLPEKADKLDPKVPLLLTNGFSTLFLIFHPYYRGDFRFDSATNDMIGGQNLVRVHFEHIRGTRTPAALAVRGREYPLDLSGNAWIDPATGVLTRIDAGLANEMRDVGLVTLSISVDYAPVQLPGWSQVYRFPVRATVEVQSLRQKWRNVHQFTNYQRFMVGTTWRMADDDQHVPDDGVKK